MSSLVIQSRLRLSYRKLGHGVLAWLLSLLVHMGGTLGLGYVTISSMAPAGTGTASRSIELTLIGAFSEPDGETVSRVVFEAAERAPALLEPPQLSPLAAEPIPPPPQITDPNLAPASYSALEQPSSAPPAAQQTATQLFGIHGYGRRFVYVFDRSSSMEGRALEAAKMQLAWSLGDLAPRDQFQVIFYNDQPVLVPPRRSNIHNSNPMSLLTGDDASKRLALQFVGGIFAEGPTNHLKALAAALELKPDVIFFLTDATGETLRPEQLAHLRRLNRTATIHTIEFGLGSLPNHPSFLAQLALENGGQHAYIDLSRLR